MPRHIEPTHQGRLSGKGLLDRVQGRGLAGEGWILPIHRVLELDPSAAEGALLMAHLLELLVLVLAAPGLAGEAGDALVEPLELAGEVGLAAALLGVEGPDLSGGEIVVQAARQVGLPAGPGLAGLAHAGQGRGQRR
jgi:hypothetical protein